MNPPPVPINIQLAIQQHEQYITLLKTLIPNVIEISGSDDEKYPDCNFIEDTAVVVNNTAIIAQLGHPLRQGEEIAVKNVLEKLHQDDTKSLKHLEQVTSNAKFDGGDILYTGTHLFVGISKRTNDDAYDQIKHILHKHEPHFSVIKLHVTEGLHLKSVITQLDTNVLLIADNTAGQHIRNEIEDTNSIRDYEFIAVPDMVACNVLRINNNVVIQENFPQSEQIIRKYADTHHLHIHKLNMSELIKSDGALTCSSILMRI